MSDAFLFLVKDNLKEVGIVEPPRANVDEMDMSRKWQLLQYAMFGAFYPNYFLRTRGNQGRCSVPS